MRRIREQKAWHTLAYIILAGLMIAAAACTYTPPATAPAPEPATPETAASPGLSGTLSGTVGYLQRIALAPDAVVEVTLQDVSKADAPAEVISTQTIETQSAQVPVAYTLEYDPAKIDTKNTYAVRATITEGGQLTWTSTKRYPVLTRGAPDDNVEIIVEQVSQDSAAATFDAAGLPALTGVLTGTVTYRQRIALPPDAVIDVQLQDVSLQDVAATVIASERYIAGGRQAPFPYELAYDPAGIDPGRTYAVAARITVDGKLRWINTQHFGVLTRRADHRRRDHRRVGRRERRHEKLVRSQRHGSLPQTYRVTAQRHHRGEPAGRVEGRRTGRSARLGADPVRRAAGTDSVHPAL